MISSPSSPRTAAPPAQVDLAGGMSSALPPPPPNYQGQEGDCRDDKKRRLQQGHHGESSSRLPDEEDLENMFSSLTIDNILSEGTSGDCCKNRKRKSCQEPPAGDLINRSPDDILENMFSALAIQDATSTSSVSRRSREQSSLVFPDHNNFSVEKSGCATSIECNDPDSWILGSSKFIDSVNKRLLCHDGTGVKVFAVHFDLNSTHAAHLDKWLQFASKSGAPRVRLHLCKNWLSVSRHYIAASRYNFPLHCFGNGQASSLRNLSLTNCIFRPSMHSDSFSSLGYLFLKFVTIADSDIQNISTCCPVLRLLRLGRCNDLVNIRISGEKLFHLDIYYCEKLVSIEINSTSLVFFEYEGYPVHIIYASTPNMRAIVTKFSDRNCALSKHLNDMKKIKRITLTFLSREEHGFIPYAKKFSLLKFVDLFVLPSWSNALAVAYLLEATPNIRRLRLEARSGKHHYLDNDQVSWPVGFSLKKLYVIVIGGFAAQAPLIELLVCLVRVATGLNLLKISPHHHLCKEMGRWVREDVGDEAARNHSRNAAKETIGLKLPPSIKFVVE